MPTNEYGVHADVCLNPTGVVGRENIAQLYEQELNFIGDCVLRQAEDIEDIDEQFEYILPFFKILETKFNTQYKFYKKEWKHADINRKERRIREWYQYGLFIHQPPFFGNVTPDMMNELYDHYGFEPYTMSYMGQEIETPMIMGKLFFIRLKHDPKSKTSIRSSGDVTINNVPAKNNNFKHHTALFSRTPVRVGEMEFTSLLTTNNIEPVMRYLSQNSSNPEERKNMINQIITAKDPFNIEKIEPLNKSQSITSQIVKTELAAISLENVQSKEDCNDTFMSSDDLMEAEEIFESLGCNDEDEEND
jgi:hypothetical protein